LALADLSDVETALVAAATGAIYPDGLMAPTITGTPVRIYRGWPLIGPLGNDLAGGVANISIFSIPNATRNTTRWAPVTHSTPGVPTLVAAVNGNAATFSGMAGLGQVAGLLVQNEPFVYRCQEGDTPALVAAMLAQLVRTTRACWLSGTTVSIPGAESIIARVVADGASVTEWTRQRQTFRITAWSPDPISRDTLCSSIGSALSSVAFLSLSDGTNGRIRFKSTASFDDDQDSQQYRRDLIYDVEYGTTVEASAPSMLFGDLIWSGDSIYG
jgi:hypothetical protein